MMQRICNACQFGSHDMHIEIIQQPPPGMLGGSSCRCKGECTDGRYLPEQFKNSAEREILKAILVEAEALYLNTRYTRVKKIIDGLNELLNGGSDG